MANLERIGGLHYEIMKRCYNKNSVMYASYGAKGITVCEEWHDKKTFEKWCLENGYKNGLRIERIDSSGNYNPANCRLGISKKRTTGVCKRSKETKSKRIMIKKICGVPKKYSNLRIYRIFKGMHNRCDSPTNTNYDNYGGRGIKVCDEWSGKYGFFYFYKWSMENGYSNELSIDRINNNFGYSPNNCRWTDGENQLKNRRCSINYFYKGKEMNLSEISKLENVKYGMLYSRVINKKMKLEDALKDIKKKGCCYE